MILSFEKMDKIINNHPNRLALVILGMLVLIFISPSFFQGRYLAPVDTTHYVAPYLDITTQMLPWWKLSGEIIRSGYIPHWNIFSGLGLPLLANMQSAIFFPLSWLFYFSPVRFALAAYSFLKLLMMGFFTFLYLRELKLKFSSSLLGAILFAFCNSNVIWFLWPLTSVILILPLSFYLIEKYFNNIQSVIPRSAQGEESLKFGASLDFDNQSVVKGSLQLRQGFVGQVGCTRDDTKTGDIKTALWLAPVIMLGLFAGHPQTFFYIFCAIYCYAIFKTFSADQFVSFRATHQQAGSEESLKLVFLQKLKPLIYLTLIFLLGFVMSAVVVFPFLEYLKLSANLDYRAGFAENPFYLQPLMFIVNFIPDFYGNTGVKNFSYLLVPNYGELALGYIGVTGLILSLFAFTKKCAKQIRFFAAAVLASLSLVYHAPIIYWLVNKLPGFNLNYNNRLLYLFAFFASILAAYGLENLLDAKISRKRLNWTFAGFTIFAAFIIVANRIVTSHWQFAHNLDWQTVSLWQDALIVAFAANLVISYFVIKNLCHCEAPRLVGATRQSNPDERLLRSDALPRNDNKKIAMLLLFVIVIVETALHGMVFMKTSKPENFYPNEPALTYLQDKFAADYFRVFTYGDTLLPNIGTWYHINQLNDHDTIYLKSNKALKANVANYNYSPEYTFADPNLNALRFLSVKYLLYPAADGLNYLKYHQADVSVAFRDNNYLVLELSNPMPRAYLVSADDITGLSGKLSALIKNLQSFPIMQVQNFSMAENGNQTIFYKTDAAAYLVTTDNYYPGWFGVIDGRQIPVQNVNGLRAILVPAGEHTITIEYHPKNFGYGYGWRISLAALIFWFGLYFWQIKKK